MINLVVIERYDKIIIKQKYHKNIKEKLKTKTIIMIMIIIIIIRIKTRALKTRIKKEDEYVLELN